MKIAYIRPDIGVPVDDTGLIREVDHDGIVRYRNSDGLLHREDGPAIEGADGTRFWYLNGEWLSEDEFEARKPARQVDGLLVGAMYHRSDSLRVRTLLRRLKKERY